MKHVLFVCVENDGRSQMAEALANYYGKGRLTASSAAIMPADRVSIVVTEAMKERSIDISSNKPRMLTTKMAEEADKIITMGCSAEKVCPPPLLKNVIEWGLEDAKEKPIEKVREIRDEIERRVKQLINGMTWHTQKNLEECCRVKSAVTCFKQLFAKSQVWNLA
jgi:arsenate reductase